MGGYISQAFIDLFPGEAAGFVSIDSSTLKRSYYPDWEVTFLRHTKAMYLSIPWKLLKPWGSAGAARSAEGRANMRSFMDGYAKREFCDVAAYGYRILADALDERRSYDIDCPALLLCGEKTAQATCACSTANGRLVKASRSSGSPKQVTIQTPTSQIS